MFVSRGSVKKVAPQKIHLVAATEIHHRLDTDAVKVNCKSYHCIFLWLISVVAEGEIEVKKK